MFWKKRRDEDDVDRLNRVWTVLILAVAGIVALVYLALFPDAAISCQPIEGSGDASTTAYANMNCLDGTAFPGKYYRDTGSFSYHTFVPLFMFYQALAFLAPHVLTQFLKRLFGSGFEFLFMYAETSKSDGSEFLSRLASPPAPSVRTSSIYLLKKILYLANSFFQLVAVAIVFSPDKSLDPGRAIYYETPFPRVARCGFYVEGDVSQYYSCVLHVNGMYLRFYMFLFYWLLVVVFANVVSLVFWFVMLFVPRLALEKIRMYTLASQESMAESPGKEEAFVREHLGKDYLLNLLLAQTTEREVTAADLTLRLWQSFAFPPSTLNELETTAT